MESVSKDILSTLNERSQAILREIVDAYVTSGEPVGSRTISRRLETPLSPATVRNVMADLEAIGLIRSPHVSAGRLPTEAGLRLFVDGLLQAGTLSLDERELIERQCSSFGRQLDDVLSDATAMISGLSSLAGLVVAPKADRPLKHAEFVNLGDGRALVVLVMEDGVVENRLIDMPPGAPPSALIQATNFLNAHLTGCTIEEARSEIAAEIDAHRTALDEAASRLVEAGLATWTGDLRDGSLILRGQAKLLSDVSALEDLDNVRRLFEALEGRELLARLLELTSGAEGVQIFIGAENNLFDLTGCSMVVAPFSRTGSTIIGAIGVIGPTRVNYARIIPIVDYTAKVVGRMLG